VPKQAQRPRVQRRPRDVRRRLLNAAMEVFARDGFHAATLDDVAAEAGLTKGAVYSNFTGKRELFLALLEERVTRRAQIARSVLSGTPPGPGNEVSSLVTALAGRLSQLGAAEPDWQLLYIEFWLFAMRDPDAHRLLAAARRRLRQAIADLAEEAQRQYGLDTGISGTRWATIILGLSNGLALERLIDPDTVPDDLLATILNRLTARPPPAGYIGKSHPPDSKADSHHA
jgi:AcrR family transcriptional regulator